MLCVGSPTPIKKSFGYKQRDEVKREKFIQEIASIDPKSLVYLDEAGIRKNEAIEYGWSKKGERLYDFRDGARAKVFNLVAALNQGKIFAPFTFEGSCNSEVFDTYIFQVLKKELKPEHVLVLDNASFHKKSSLEKLAKIVGCRFIFLPPYSPDLNPIEHYWHSIKTKLKKLLRDFPTQQLTEITHKIFFRLDAG
jgi:transposase